MPQVYVSCISAYNNGILHGAWIDAAQDPDDLRAAIQAMLQESPAEHAEEWRIDDHDFYGLEPPSNLEKLSELAFALEEHGEVYALWAGCIGLDYATSEGFKDKFIGSYENLAEYAETLLEEQLNELPADLRFYFDFQRYGEDLDRGGDIIAILDGGQVHVFNPL
jgi:antirestriction protein